MDEKEIVRLYLEENKTFKDLGIMFNRDKTTIGRILKRNGVSEELILERRAHRGEDHPRWTGGRMIDLNGYVKITIQKDDPFYIIADSNNRAFEHRYVMAKYLGRALTKNETVHHINGDRQDNRIENLQLRQGNHGPGQKYQCNSCGSHDIIKVQL